MFAYKLNTPLPLLEDMYMYDIVLMFNKLNEILKKENGEDSESNTYDNKINEYQSNMNSQINDYKSQISSSMPKMPNNLSNIGNLTAGFKMPKI